MKTRYKLLLAVLLIWAQVFAPSLTGGGSALFAQDAFYIYRNDGDFNGFFFDEIKRMGVSKLDLDSIEHDVYVVQEIETADSIYRIPLAAIDSIGFQQPEIIFSPKLKDLDKLGLSDYVTSTLIIGSNRGTIHISASVPAERIPQVGDVVCSFTNPKFKNYDATDNDDFSGFAGKVYMVYSDIYHNGDYKIQFEPCTELSDIFMQFISTERVTTDAEGNVRRRLAGFNDDGKLKSQHHAYSASDERTLLDLSGTIKREWEPQSGVNIDLEAGYELKVYLSMTYNITWKRIFVKTSLGADLGITPALGVKTSKSFEVLLGNLPKTLKSIKFPAVCPLFQTAPLPDLFVRGGGEIGAKLSLPSNKFHLVSTVTIDSDLPYLPFRWSMSKTPPPGHEDDAASMMQNTGGVDISLSGFMQAGLKFSLNLSSNDWISKIFYSGIYMDVFCGPKVEGSLNYSSKYLDMPDYSVYQNWKNSNIKLTGCSVDFETKASAGLFWYDPVERTFFDGNMSFLQGKFYLFPEFTKYGAESVDGTATILSHVEASRKVFWPCRIGMGLFDQEGQSIEREFDSKSYYAFRENKDYKFDTKFVDVKPGIYKVRPILDFMGVTIDSHEIGQYVTVKPALIHERPNMTDTVEVPTYLDSWTVEFMTTANELSAYYADDPSNSIIHLRPKLEIRDLGDKNRILEIHMGINNDYKKREWDIVLEGWTGTASGNLVARDTIHVMQDIRDDLFTHAIIDASFIGEGTNHIWGNDPQLHPYLIGEVPYDVTKPATSYIGSAKGILQCTRNGNIFVCSGSFSDNRTSSSVHLTVDLSSPDSVKVLSGSFTGTEGSSDSSWTVRRTYSGNWNYPVPSTPSNKWLPSLWPDLNYNGWLHFRLDGKQAFSGSFSATTRYAGEHSGEQVYYNSDYNITTNGEEGYLEIWLAY